MDISTDKMQEELAHDFETLLSKINPEGYNPNSQDFRNALMTGAMMFLLNRGKDAKTASSKHDEIKEEMEDAEKYYNRYKATNDAMFRQMAQDELRHADYVLRQRMLTPMTEEEKEKFTKYGEWIKSYMAKTR